MRLAFVAQPFDRMEPPVQAGSLALWIYQVARRCARRGHETFVFSNSGSSSRLPSARHEDVEYIYTPAALNRLVNRGGRAVTRLRPSWLNRRGRVPPFAAPWQDAGYGLEVSRAISRLDCDAVLVMNFTQLVPIIRRFNRRSKIYLYMQCEWLTQLATETMRKRMEMADLVAGCSEYITETIIQRFPSFRDRCVTLTNAATPADADIPAQREPYHVLFVGRVSPEKGIHILVEAFHQVLRRFPQAHLHVIGGAGSAPLDFLVRLSDDARIVALSRFYEPTDSARDPYLWHLEKAAGCELGRRILFEGAVDHDRTATAYRRTSLLVNPSLSESFGMTLVEAMMHGVPVVASNIGGMPYIVKAGETGLLVSAGDAAALANAICDVLADDAKATGMGEAGRKRAMELFTWERTADTLLRQLQTLQQTQDPAACRF